MNDKETKRETDADAAPALDQRGNTPPAPVEVRKPLGKLISLRTRGWVRLKALQGDLTSIILPSNAEAISLALKGLLESVLAETGYSMLAEVLRETKLDLIVTADVVIPRTGELRLDAEKQLVDIIDELCRHDMAAEARAVQENIYWTIPLANVALALVPCESDPVDYQTGHLVLETPLSDIQARLERAHEVGSKLVADCERWKTEHVDPLFADLKNELASATLPSAFRQELEALRIVLERDVDVLLKGRSTADGAEPSHPVSMQDLICTLTMMGDRFSKLTENVQPALQSFLNFVVVASQQNKELFPTLDDKQTFAKHLQALLDRLGLAVESPNGIPSRLEGFRRGNSPGGGFRFRYPDGGSESAGPPLAPLPLVAKPPHKLAKP